MLVVDAKPGVRRAHFLIKDAKGVVRMVVQTKKLDHRRRTSNIMTREAAAFNAQRPIRGLPLGPRVTLGYLVVNGGTGTSSPRPSIGFWAGRRSGASSYALDRMAAQLRLPVDAPAAKPRVTGKKGVAKPAGKESGQGGA